MQDYAYEHMQLRNCNNVTVMGDVVMYNSLSRLPFTQGTIVGASKDARNLRFQVSALSLLGPSCSCSNVNQHIPAHLTETACRLFLL